MKAVILAGGYGTRLRPLTCTTPKPMLPLLGKPVLQHIVEGLTAQGFDEIIITTNYLREQVINHFRDGKAFGVKMIYPEEQTPLGTAGSVKNTDAYFDDTFAVVQGDGVTNISMNDLMKFHEEKGGIATLALTPVENPSEYGIVELDSTANVIRFQEKPKPEEYFSNLANTGIYILEPEALKHIPTEREYDFSNNLFPKILRMGKKIFGYRTTGFWVDIGQPEKYMEAIHWALRRWNETLASTPIRETTKIDPHANIDGQAMLGDRCHIGRGAIVEGYSVIGKGVKVAKETRITNSVIYQGSYIGPSSHIDHSIVAEECRIGSHVNITTSIIGAYCNVGDKARVYPGSKIWPKSEIDAHSTMRGTIPLANNVGACESTKRPLVWRDALTLIHGRG